MIRAFVAVVLATSCAAAQQTGRGASVPPRVTAGVVRDDTSAQRGVQSGREVVVTTQTNIVRLVAMDVPGELRGREGRFEFVSATTFGLIGAMRGTIPAAAAPRPVAIAVAVPVTARAGRNPIGVLRFTCIDGCDPIDVSVVLDVLPRHALDLSPSRALLGTHAGARVRTSVTLQNAGNATELVQLVIEAPEGWRARVTSELPVHVDAGGNVTADIEITVADAAEIGDYGMVVHATPAAGPAVMTSFNLRVGSGHRGVTGVRPLVEASVAVAGDDQGTVVPAVGATLSGEFVPGVRASGRTSLIRNDDSQTLGLRSLGRLGYAEHNSFLFLTAPSWNAAVGNIGSSNAGLVGSSVWGLGATAQVTQDRWRAGALAATPTGRGDAVDGRYVTGDFARRVGRLWGGALFGELRDNVIGDRYARTAAGQVTLPWAKGLVDLQVGQRATSAGDGTGWLARAEHRTRTWGFGSLAGHTPGGSAAFGRSSDEVQFDAFRQVHKRVTVSGGVWSNTDEGGTIRSQSRGWSATPQLDAGSIGTIAADLHASDWTGENNLGTFGNGEEHFGLSWNGSVRKLQTRLGGSHGSLSRETSVGALSVSTRVPRSTFFASAMQATGYGSWQFDVSLERSGEGAGVPTRQSVIGVRADQVPVWPGRAQLHAQFLAHMLSGTGSSVSSQIVGVRIRLSDAYRIVLDGERNGFQRFGGRGAPWVVSTKVEHSIGLPVIRGGGRVGTVFGDINGDGVRNSDERGVAGAIVRVDGDQVTTDDKGRFAVGRARPQVVEVDPRSLPPGWVAPPREIGARGEGALSLAVVPTSPVEIVLRVAASVAIDSARVVLENVVVVLTDSLGRRWTGAPDAKGVLRFDALPPGSYEVNADLSRLTETLVLPANLARVRVLGPGELQRIVVTLSSRPIRIVPPPSDRVRRVSGGSGGSTMERP